MPTKIRHKKKSAAKTKARAMRASSTMPISGEFHARVPVRIGGVAGYLTASGARRAVDVLEEIGFEIEAPIGSKKAIRDAAVATTAEPSTRLLTNRVAVLTESDVDMQALEESAVAKSMQFRRELLTDALTIADAKEALGVSSQQTIHNWIRQKKILALPDRHRLMIPPWQFDPESRDGIVVGIDRVLQVIDGNPFGIAFWFITRNKHLENEAPIDLLRRGCISEVVEEAQGVGLAQ